MKLKSIHISGFKSFADRTTIQYHDGITGVIGPNGSGKSNIIDAVRWVMGEQTSKNLRADDPTDIIFAGSQTRKGLGMADVTLVFHNDGIQSPPEFSHLPEISIGRRINRAGEREYFLNREPCRLKDIVDFLLSIGLGSKSYAIIQQDKRDRIIQASPEDLREILEETAGISIFKTRRKEAQKRLESTDERIKNLAEIENELSRQKESLQEQVEKAKQKIELTNELKDLEINLLSNHVGFYRDLSKKINLEIINHRDEIKKSTVDTTEFEIHANELKSDQLSIIQDIKLTENHLDDARIAFTKYDERQENYKRRHEERLLLKQNLKKDMANEKEVLEREETRQKEFLKLLEDSEKDLRTSDGELETLNDKLEEIDEFLQVENFRKDEMRSEIRAIENTKNTLNTKNEGLLEQISKISQSIVKTQENEKNLQTTRGQFGADKDFILQSLNQMSCGIDTKITEKNNLETELNTFREKCILLKDDRDNAKEKLLEVLSHVNSLKKLIDSNTGLSDGCILLKNKLSKLIQGFLFEKCSLHKDDESIVELSLPYLFQSAFIENQNEFIPIVDKLEEMNASKTGFYFLDSISALNEDELRIKNEVLQLRGIRNVADRLESVALPQIKNLFERIFICEDEWGLFKAKKISQNINNFIFITERGSVSNTFFHYFYGHDNETEATGLLHRKRELAFNMELKDELESKLAQSEGVLFESQEKRSHFENKLSLIQNQMDKEKVEVLKLTSSVESLDLQIRHLEDSLTRSFSEKSKLEKEIAEIQEFYSKNRNQIDKLELEYKELIRNLAEFESDFLDKKSIRDEISYQIQSKKSGRAVLSERQSGFRRNYEECTYQLTRVSQKLHNLMLKYEDVDIQIQSNQSDYENLSNELNALRHKIQKLEIILDDYLKNESEISEKLRIFEMKIKNQKEFYSTKQKFITEKQLELARVDAILETAIKEAQEKFALPPEALLQESLETPQSKNKMEQRICEVHEELSCLGPVNERAVNEFRDVVERLDFLVFQKNDIQKSMEELRFSIQEIEETTKTRFKEIFDKVNIEFQRVFPVLFPNGFGKLHMLNEADLLTTGVEILVQLPGKKMQNMALFSGGEKALTAISLIFSLLKTTPAPFCFLDEVDAPLDEANVGRFNNVIDALSHEFQFVIITHNRRTMEVLDTIYGISMSEPGVSKLVSVDLSEVPNHLKKKSKEKESRQIGVSLV